MIRRVSLSVGEKGLKRTPMKRTGLKPKRRPVSPASSDQKQKVDQEGRCRACKAPDGHATIDPAHVVDRSLGGCDEALCVVALCRTCHGFYDRYYSSVTWLDLLPFLTLEEQAHAVSHLGIARAWKRLTNERFPQPGREARE